MKAHEFRIIAQALTDLRRRRAHRLRESEAPAPIVPSIGKAKATLVVGYGR